MTQQEIYHMAVSDAKHAIGIGKKSPYVRHGKRFYKPWRNYFNIDTNNPTWVWMESQGYAGHRGTYSHGTSTTTFYYLTRSGLNWLGRELDVTIYDEED